MRSPLSNAFAAIVLAALSFNLVSGQTIPSKTPSEQAAADGIATQIQQFGGNDAYSVSAAGDIGLSVPLQTVTGRSLSLPLGLSYSPGIKVDQKSGEAGLGWDLGFGAIARDIGDFEPDYTASSRFETEGFNPNITGTTGKSEKIATTRSRNPRACDLCI